MGKHYPSRRYHPEKESLLVLSAEHEQALGAGWYESPAHFGVETEPSLIPDQEIAEIKAKFLAESRKPTRKSARRLDFAEGIKE